MINGQWTTEAPPIRRIGLPALLLGSLGLWLAGAVGALAEDNFERCKSISADQPRLDCFKGLLARPSSSVPKTEDRPLEDVWPLVRTLRPNGAGEAVAVTRTAETTQSDPDLAGLMIRCQEKSKFDVLLALVRPVPPRSKREVTINIGSAEAAFQTEALPTGMALMLPVDATIFTTGAWHDLKEFSVRIHDPGGDIRGTILLEGIRGAIAKLSASCR